MRKKICLLVILLLLTTGCTVNRFTYTTYEDTINKVLSYNLDLYNVSLEGYKYYLPKGTTLYEKYDTNSIIKYNNTKLYLYVDIVSYYHKEENKFTSNNDAYYSKEIKYGDKFGYLEITKMKSLYFIEYMYNYSKIEAYVSEENINDTIYVISTILSSVNYNDKVLDSIIGNNSLIYNEETFDILTPKKEKVDVLEYDYNSGLIYEGYKGDIIEDEDSIKIDGNLE